MTIKKIFDGNFDDEVHISFLKFGRGEYKDKFLLEGKRQASKWAIKAGAEYANFLVKTCLEKSPETIFVKGVIVSTSDLREELPFEVEKIKNFQGVRKHVINTELKSVDILKAMGEHPRTFFALSFKGDDFLLKIKPKAPASGKPGKDKEEGPKADFCTLKTPDKNIIEELFFDNQDFKEIRATHKIVVEDIVYPSNMEDLSPKEVREQAKRKGTIYRKVTSDGNETISEAKFVA